MPAGTGWYDFYTGQFLAGGQQLTQAAPLERVPLFVPKGAILPVGPEIQYASEKPVAPLTLYVFTGPDGQFSLYEDENVNYNYEQGAFATIALRYDDKARTLTIGARQGSFPGMAAQRTFHVVWVRKDKPTPLNFSKDTGKAVSYSGSAVIVRVE